MDVEQKRARRIGRIGGMDFSAGEPPQEVGVDSAEGEFASRRQVIGAGNVLEEPRKLAAGKIGIEHKSGLRRDRRLVARLLEPDA